MVSGACTDGAVAIELVIMAADIQQLTAELNSISQQRYEARIRFFQQVALKISWVFSARIKFGLLLQVDEKLKSYSRGRGRGRGGLGGRGSLDSRPSYGAGEVSELPSRPLHDNDRHEARPQSRSRFADRLGPPNEASISERHDVRLVSRSIPPLPTASCCPLNGLAFS